MARGQQKLHRAYSSKTVMVLAIMAVLVVFCAFCYRNVFLESQTQKSLGTLCKAYETGQLRDYHNTIGLESIDDIKYNYDELLKVHRLYYGNYTVYLSDVESESWSPESLAEYLGKIGITCVRSNGRVIFYFFGEEVATDKW